MWLASNSRGNAATILLTFERRSTPSFGEFRLPSCAMPSGVTWIASAILQPRVINFPYALLNR
jgi:hypothetical protein